MKKRLSIILFVGLSLIYVESCKQDEGKFISEGSIEFAASVIDQSNSMASMAPSKMTVHFKKNKSCVEMSAGMGLFTTSFVSNPDNRTLTQMVKLLNKKFWLLQSMDEIQKDIDSYKFEIKPTKETKIIAGYTCTKAIVHKRDSDDPDFVIYYTKELNITNPNFSNPFSNISGVLMEYQLKKFGLEMKFVATKVVKEPIDDILFEVPSDFKKITSKEMNELFEGLH